MIFCSILKSTISENWIYKQSLSQINNINHNHKLVLLLNGLICQGYTSFQITNHQIQLQIGNGMNIQFWEDVWIGDC